MVASYEMQGTGFGLQMDSCYLLSQVQVLQEWQDHWIRDCHAPYGHSQWHCGIGK